MNKFGFNGLYRVNRAGIFNVPYGKPARLPLFPFDAAAAASHRLESASILSGDFQTSVEMAGVGDLVYCDPPYLSSSSGPSFQAYTATGFDMQDHIRLTEAAKAAALRGATVLISNHDTPCARHLYRDFEVQTLTATRSVSSKASSRGKCEELVAIVRP